MTDEGDQEARFQLFSPGGAPTWRSPQLGALGALVAHWSLPQHVPALLSLPTGTGKTAVATAARRLLRATRTLVVVPSVELRSQLADAFESEDLLRRIGALTGGTSKTVRVKSVVGKLSDWDDVRSYDVVVGIPNSVSPRNYDDDEQVPPQDLFDLIIVDEAHHSPAPTWRAIIDHYSSARAVLLTATPRRRDGQKLPGEHVYHYPLRQALSEGIFKPIRPVTLELRSESTKAEVDDLIAAHASQVLADSAHETSTLLVRASSHARAGELGALYRKHGVEIEVLHSRLSSGEADRITGDLRAGTLRGVAVVGMLIEGFDLPSLRVLAYHDKHRSLPVTAQIVGRLARVDERFPQESVMITAKDIDVFPELRGVVRALYEEDADWTTVLPGIIDDEIAIEKENREYARAFTPSGSADIAVDELAPVRRCVIYEAKPGSHLKRGGFFSDVPDSLHPGRVLRGEVVMYAGLSPDGATLVVVTQAIERPRWHMGDALDAPRYALHVLSWRSAPRTNLPDLILVNSDNTRITGEMLYHLDEHDDRRLADPVTLQEAFDTLDRVSVSSVGLRNSYGGQLGQASYKMLAGKGVDRGMSEGDSAFGTLGHAMVQILTDGASATAGVATGKGKYWETRYSPLRQYDDFLTEFAERYWFPPTAPGGPLLPQVSRGRRLEEYPESTPLAAEFDGALMGTGWSVQSVGALDTLEVHARLAQVDAGGLRSRLPVEIVDPRDSERVVWSGYQDLMGLFHPDGGDDLSISRGFGARTLLSDLLTLRPPTVFFSDGKTVIGTTVITARITNYDLPLTSFRELDWSGVDIESETRSTAERRARGRSVHEGLEAVLGTQTRRCKRRWIIHNDGAGEFADYIVVEVGPQRVMLDLWHAKAAQGATASVRTGDLEVAVAQAIKSRRWITDEGFWHELTMRLDGRRSPKASVLEGRPSELEILCGSMGERALSFTRTKPVVVGRIGIVQPGLSYSRLQHLLADQQSLQAKQVRDLLAVFHDTVSKFADTTVLCSA